MDIPMEKKRNTHISRQGHRPDEPSNVHMLRSNVSGGNLAESLWEIPVAGHIGSLPVGTEAPL